ncbi:MAG: hypothetical protein KZQ70_12680 [gamma proteobacterium symbiont of Lucinoma myriamae]|nr:hypothetical protein [gamma proteobacterium symbiont of Lucinoma myriamae]
MLLLYSTHIVVDTEVGESGENGFTVSLAQQHTMPSLPYREEVLVNGLSQKKAYTDLLE